MDLLEVDPFEVHFADHLLERNWLYDWKRIPRELLDSIRIRGFIDPVIVYTVDSRLCCWRGTKRVRIARFLGLKKIKVLLLDEPIDTKPCEKEIQRLYKKPINLFLHPSLNRWDVKGALDPVIYPLDIQIFVPSYQREEKLIKFFTSLLTNRKYILNLNVYYDNRPEEGNRVYANQVFQKVAKRLTCDLFFYFGDDMTFYPDTLEKAVTCYLDNFPELDGIVELNQVNVPQPVDGTPIRQGTGVFLVGKKFYQHFPGNSYFCPDYFHFFVDQEAYLYAKSINKFKRCEESRVRHNNPKYCDEKADHTFESLRLEVKDKDVKTLEKRRALGYLWGKDFKKIND